MSSTTIKRREILSKNPDTYIGSRVPNEYKQIVISVAKKNGMDQSKFIRLAVEEKIERLENQ